MLRPLGFITSYEELCFRKPVSKHILGDVAQAELLLCKHKALNSNPNPTKEHSSQGLHLDYPGV
jgi:hypothetical protein